MRFASPEASNKANPAKLRKSRNEYIIWAYLLSKRFQDKASVNQTAPYRDLAAGEAQVRPRDGRKPDQAVRAFACVSSASWIWRTCFLVSSTAPLLSIT